MCEYTQTDLSRAVETLQNGQVLLYPTDTVWGLGCDASNDTAITQIFEIKKRSQSKSMIVIFDTVAMVEKHFGKLPADLLEFLATQTRPTTIVYPYIAKNDNEQNKISQLLVASGDTLAFRIADDDFCRDLIKQFGSPIVSTSANISGQPTAAIFEQISENIKKSANYIVEYRQNDKEAKEPSQIIRWCDGKLEKLR